MKPLVSICIITYNHEKFIASAIESVLMQKTTFDFEIVLGEDYSTDRTREICIEYKKKFGDKIKLLLNDKNLGVIPNFVKTLSACTGKYVALCEGDDYWTDPFKLQKQIDFLESNSAYSLCFHDAVVLWDDKSHQPEYFCTNDQKATATIYDVINKWFVPTASMVFRAELIKPLPEWFQDIYNGDYALDMLLANKGPIGYLKDVMSVYRKSDSSLSRNIGKNYQFVGNQKIKLLNYFNSYTDFKYNYAIETQIKNLEKEMKIYKSKIYYKLYKISLIILNILNIRKL